MAPRRVIGLIMEACGVLLLAATLAILFHHTEFSGRFAAVLGIPGVLIGGLGCCFLLIEGETLVESGETEARSPPR